MAKRRWALAWLPWLWCNVASLALAQAVEAPVALPPEEIIVRGKLPGPPLWRISSGDHVLWVFGSLAPVPEAMAWDSARVARVIANAEVFLPQPAFGITAGIGLLANPLNWVRGVRLAKSLPRDPQGRRLAEAVPAEQYQRFAALLARYSLRAKDFEEQRPYFAIQDLLNTVYREEGLTGPFAVNKEIRRLVKRNRSLVTVDTSTTIAWDKSFRELAAMAEDFRQSLPAALELSCFEGTLTRLENDLDALQLRAAAWAEGNIDALRATSLHTAGEDPCEALQQAANTALLDGAVQALSEQMEARWFAAVDDALANHATSFAVVGIDKLLDPDGWLQRLRDKGYRVQEPDE